MGNKALLPRNADPYDSGIDSDEGKHSVLNAVFVKNLGEVKIRSKNIFNKNIAYEKLEKKYNEDEHKKSFPYKNTRSGANGGRLNYGEDDESDSNRPLINSKSQEQLRLTSVDTDPSDEKWTTYDSDNDRDSPQLYEIELTASDEDDNSVLEVVIPVQAKIRHYHWLLEFFCFACLQHYE